MLDRVGPLLRPVLGISILGAESGYVADLLKHALRPAFFTQVLTPRGEKRRIDSTRGTSSALMAYVDHAFSISDEDIFMGDSGRANRNRPPVKEIAFAVSLLVFGFVGIVVGSIMAADRIGGDRAHGVFFAILGSVLFLPGFYYTRIAYYAYKGYKGFTFDNIPTV
ncbi:hypothetical protein ZIOFF_049709 [Zingiber officinale]|uniref:Transmembrane protein 230 n=2 Tax=Zingiber officinale TaxID=94328 RepID=A0A8J5FNF4_ZINOF|nr:hypothetical protein ZIOFF_049709 [Zingiber officinale]